MDKTLNANRLTICIFGNVNSGKSSLFNAITGTDTAIVSDIPGTTTDPVIKAMELLPHGPVVFIDTAGIDDSGLLGKERVKKTKTALNRADFAIYAFDPQNIDIGGFENFKAEFEKRRIPYIKVMTKSDLNIDIIQKTTDIIDSCVKTSIYDGDSINRLKTLIAAELDKIKNEKLGLLHGIIEPGGVAVLVAPIDSEAPKGRLILPQTQLIRECLDNNIRCNVTTVETLEDAVRESERIDIIITDSQAFREVDRIAPPDIMLTSFSILMARQKGDINKFIEGANHIKHLKNGDKILIAETCTHTTGHEDIGRIKIPEALERITGKKLIFEFSSGRDYPDGLDKFALIVHCGGCMISQKEFTNRIIEAECAEVPVTNYGIALAYCNGILDRSIKFMELSRRHE